MLDKSIAYHNFIMAHRPNKSASLKGPKVPEGFTLRGFLPGDEKHWARVETLVLEFDREEEAVKYFIKEYGPHPDQLEGRCFLLFDEKQNPIATASAWFEKIGDETIPMVHWVAVVPQYQGQGLGRLVMEKVLYTFSILSPGETIYLHTQTWSYKAVWMYHRLGFALVKNKEPFIDNDIPLSYRSSHNDYDQGIEVLAQALGGEKAAILEGAAL